MIWQSIHAFLPQSLALIHIDYKECKHGSVEGEHGTLPVVSYVKGQCDDAPILLVCDAIFTTRCYFGPSECCHLRHRCLLYGSIHEQLFCTLPVSSKVLRCYASS